MITYPRAIITLFLKNGSKRAILGGKDNWRHLYSKTEAADFSRAFLKVSYGKHEDTFGKMVMFTNEGTYTNKKDLKQALSAFLEVRP